MRLIVVRHAMAIAKRRWDGPDVERPLTPHGARQAKAVAARLARYRPAEIISSPSLRCRQTVGPLATKTARPVQNSKRLGIDAGDGALELIRELVRRGAASSTIIVCTHREVLVETLPVLSAEFAVKLGHRPPGAKGCYWTLRFRDDQLVSVKYSHLTL